MWMAPLGLTALIAGSAAAGVVIQMPAVPAAPASSAGPVSQTSKVSPLQRFALGEPAKDRAGNAVQYGLSPTVTYGGGGSGWGGYGRGGYGRGGYGWGWGYPIILVPCCNPCDQPMPVWRGTSVSIGIGL
jgi:hypothetical protein